MDSIAPVALITGASSGLGKAVSIQLAEQDISIAVNYFNASQKDNATEVISEIRRSGRTAIAIEADVSDDIATRKMIEKIITRLGRLDFLVNNAGTTHFVDHSNLEALTADMWTNILNVNVIGAFQVTRAAAPHLKATGNGAVVNVASISGYTGRGSSIAYAASKGALITMTRSLARALGPEIRVNAVAPGFMDTTWYQSRPTYQERSSEVDEHHSSVRRSVTETSPLGFIAQPEDVSDSVVSLLLHNRYVTGQTVIVDGGRGE